MIELENVRYRYPNTERDAVQNITIRVGTGELKLVTGPSGCGKTTVMRLVNGLAPQILGGSLKGEVRVAGRSVPDTPVAELSTLVGTLFQDPEDQFFALNVGDEVSFALKSRGVPPEEISSRVAGAAERLGITGLLTQDVHALSEGEKQKVGLAAILALGPKVLVLDEPSANLDPEATTALAQTLETLKAEGAAILVVDHRLYWLSGVADEVIVMDSGRIVRRGPFGMLEDEAFRTKQGLRLAHVEDPRPTLPRIPVSRGESLPDTFASLFSVRHLTFAYKGAPNVFENAAFDVPRGVTALIGKNGSGKTTLARLLTGLEKGEGTFALRGAAVERGALMPHAGLVLQNADHQLQMRTVIEEVETARLASVAQKMREQKGWVARLHRPKLSDEDREAAWAILRSLRIDHLARRHPQSLSGGEKQRVVIAAALAKDPAILILDEPTSGLDGANLAAIAALLRREASKGRAVFLITHDLELLAHCDQALDMRELARS